MSRIKVRIVSFIVNIVLIISSFLSYSVSVYATSDGGVYEPGTSWWHKFTTEFGSIVRYAANQYNAFVKGDDFSQYLKNQEDFEEWWNTGHISYDDSTNSFTFDEDFGKYFKQALIDYANEMNGFYIIPTESWHDLDPTKFSNSNIYYTIRSLAINNGMVAVYYDWYKQYIYACPMTDYLDGEYVLIQSPVISFDPTSIDYYSNYYYVSMTNTDWTNRYLNYYKFPFDTDTRIYTSFSEGTEMPSNNYYFTTLYMNFIIRNGYPYNIRYGEKYASLISNDGCRVRVYKSLNSYKLYSAGQRAVYFGSGFYDAEVGDLTASFDDVADSMDRLDKTLRDLLDKIDDNTDESKIEELLQQILDQMKDNNSGNGNSSGSGTGSSGSKDYTGFLGAILEYLDIIVDYLAGILEGIENLVFLEWTDQDDNNLNDLNNLWKGIKEDPETGSQAAADVLTTSFSDLASGLTKKFPFSIPWDLYALFSVFSEVDSPQTVSLSADAVMPYSIRDGDIQPLDIDMDDIKQDVHDAPYFKLPIKVESFGIYEEIIVDMKDFGTLSTLSRTLFSLIFAVFLLKFTIKILALFRGGDGE